MAILGAGYIRSIDIGSTDPTKINISLFYVGIASGNPVGQQTLNMTDVAINVTTTIFASDIKSAIKNALTTAFGYSFGLLDDVTLIGSSLL